MSQDNEPTDFKLEKMVEGLDLLHSQQIGRVMLAYGEFEHDDFIDGLDRTIQYPDDAP